MVHEIGERDLSATRRGEREVGRSITFREEGLSSLRSGRGFTSCSEHDQRGGQDQRGVPPHQSDTSIRRAGKAGIDTRPQCIHLLTELYVSTGLSGDECVKVWGTIVGIALAVDVVIIVFLMVTKPTL
jgi:hypothetical protein